MQQVLNTGAAALLFAATFLFGGGVHPFRTLIRDRRTLVSFGAGMSAAYVFVHLMPELHSAREAYSASTPLPVRFEGMATYYLALVGFLLFYGLDVVRGYLKESENEERPALAFKLHVGGFAAYVFLMGYLLVHSLEEGMTSTWLYAVPIAFHFLAVDHSLRTEHGSTYDRIGRPLLAGASLAGWAVGELFALPRFVLALLVAFLSGAIIMNNTVMEMPSEKDGRFLPFMMGGVVYGLILLPLG